MSIIRQVFLIVLSLSIFSGCAMFNAVQEKPKVTVKSIGLAPGNGTLMPRVKINLHIVNPNRTPLPLEGIFYTVKLADQQVISGASNELPTIAGYSEEDISLFSDVDLIGGAKMMAKSLFNGDILKLKYNFDAKIDTGKLSPALHINKDGELYNIAD